MSNIVPAGQPTRYQLAKLQMLKKEFGHAIERTYKVDKRTGIMRVNAKCAAGTWTWWFDGDGELVDKALTTRLVDVAPVTRPPRSAIDN